ncbi:MAG: hypothetical protein MRY72_04315 [Aquisalinus sp.]|nr:hypothetical protein [Aquisalinus sp.]
MKYVLLSISLLCVGCANKVVTFVTSTELGVDADTTTQNVTIGYSRKEAVIGPIYETGAIPPVFADIKSSTSVFRPRVSQFYATGEAARLATTKEAVQQDENAQLSGRTKRMYFGTSSNVGLQARFTGGQPTSVNFGYKRQEYSRIPIIENDEDEDVYGSVLANIQIGTNINNIGSTSLEVGQIFATGDAANQLAPYTNNAIIKETIRAAGNVGGSYADDENTRILRQKQIDDDTFNSRLEGWLAANNIDVSTTTFIETDQFPVLKSRAIQQLLEE